LLTQLNVEGKLTLGVKKLLMISEMARQDVDKVEKFVGTIQDECVDNVISLNNGIR
jgi:vesicle-fusing ATPase